MGTSSDSGGGRGWEGLLLCNWKQVGRGKKHTVDPIKMAQSVRKKKISSKWVDS